MKITNRKYFERDRALIRDVKSGNGDALLDLFNCYLPLVKSFWARYYLYGMEFDDWKQEAVVVMLKGIRHYHLDRKVSFGAYYKSILRNRFYDLIRKQNAAKRVPVDSMTSIDANESFYADTIRDAQTPCPEHRVLLSEGLKRLFLNCSPLERLVLIGVCHDRSPSEIASSNHYSLEKVNNAFARCKRKYDQLGPADN